jgi:hypothetical protein
VLPCTELEVLGSGAVRGSPKAGMTFAGVYHIRQKRSEVLDLKMMKAVFMSLRDLTVTPQDWLAGEGSFGQAAAEKVFEKPYSLRHRQRYVVILC